jgi:lipopolysaccharide transport system permease protein
MNELAKAEPSTIYIKPTTGLAALNLRDLWVYRELVLFMIWRTLKVRYKQTALGAAWAVIQPLMTMIVFNFIFGNVAKVPTDDIP